MLSPFLILGTLFTQISCFEKCNIQELENALSQDGADLVPILEEACELEPELIQALKTKKTHPELDAAFSEQCPNSPPLQVLLQDGKRQHRQNLLETCPEALGDISPKDFLWSNGAPLWAITIRLWLEKKTERPDIAKKIGQILLKDSLPLPTTLPNLPIQPPTSLSIPASFQSIFIDKEVVVSEESLGSTSELLHTLGNGTYPFGDFLLPSVQSKLKPQHPVLLFPAKETSVKLLIRILASIPQHRAQMVFSTGTNEALDWIGTQTIQLHENERSNRLRIHTDPNGTRTYRLHKGEKALSMSIDQLPVELADLQELSIEVLHDISYQDLLFILSQLPQDSDVGLFARYKPCVPQTGMQCVEGNIHYVGTDKRPIELSTFYIDTQHTTTTEYKACVKSGFCLVSTNRGEGAQTRIMWRQALRYCLWKGKRLPSEWEWEIGSPNQRDKEWTETWAELDLGSCGIKCSGTDPIGPCGGDHPCYTHKDKIVRGGSSYIRNAYNPLRAPKNVGFRCAKTHPWDSIDRPSPPNDLQPLSDEDLASLHDIEIDPIWEKERCEGEPGTVTLSCRDPLSYITSNEGRSYIVQSHLERLGGAYVGVGADQNYTFSALAQSRVVWLFDYDPDVVAQHEINIALLKESPSASEFVEKYNPSNHKETRDDLARTFANHPEREYFLAHYQNSYRTLYPHYRRLLQNPKRNRKNWLRDAELYAHIHTLAKHKRMIPVKGDLTGKKAMRSIAKAARTVGIPIRIIYTSNAPEVWNGVLTPDFRANLAALPTDRASIVLQSFIRETGYGDKEGKWHFNVQHAPDFQMRIANPSYDHIFQIVKDRMPASDSALTISGLPQ
ncbi:MAG: SUMF1/EgtB/PvdO family nonheme iron enzyme [Myxococcota bacterium]|nr:SUMF1/EgtB/PvdO family nonheme iron enzyme [Myxococcota bacterium]